MNTRPGCYEYCESTRAATTEELDQFRDAYAGPGCGITWPQGLFWVFVGFGLMYLWREFREFLETPPGYD